MAGASKALEVDAKVADGSKQTRGARHEADAPAPRARRRASDGSSSKTSCAWAVRRGPAPRRRAAGGGDDSARALAKQASTRRAAGATRETGPCWRTTPHAPSPQEEAPTRAPRAPRCPSDPPRRPGSGGGGRHAHPAEEDARGAVLREQRVGVEEGAPRLRSQACWVPCRRLRPRLGAGKRGSSMPGSAREKYHHPSTSSAAASPAGPGRISAARRGAAVTRRASGASTFWFWGPREACARGVDARQRGGRARGDAPDLVLFVVPRAARGRLLRRRGRLRRQLSVGYSPLCLGLLSGGTRRPTRRRREARRDAAVPSRTAYAAFCSERSCRSSPTSSARSRPSRTEKEPPSARSRSPGASTRAAATRRRRSRSSARARPTRSGRARRALA